jgi:pimeloyl-ACP methyl ester carboxylesterase
MKEHKKMEASLRQAEVQQDYSNWFNDADQLKSNEKPISDPRFNEDAERSNTKKGGRLVDYTIGPYSHEKPNRPMTVTVHGVANSPEGVKPLSDRAEKAGDKVKTFMYDDTGARLAKSSHDLAKSLEKQLKENPDRPLRIDAHSMGGRVALAAVDELNRKGLLKGRKVELNLVASAINGDSRGTAALVAAKSPILGPALAEAPYIKSGQDMSSHSAFQDRLDDIKFPPNVKVRVFTGGEDSNVDRDEKFEAMCKQLHAERVHFPKADHDTAVDDAAKWLSKHDRS